MEHPPASAGGGWGGLSDGVVSQAWENLCDLLSTPEGHGHLTDQGGSTKLTGELWSTHTNRMNYFGF